MKYTIQVFKVDNRSRGGKKLVNVHIVDLDENEVKAMVTGMAMVDPKLEISWYPTYTTVRNLMSGAECKIRTEEVGTCVDPSTERYWSM